jgi:tetratricopeptide (TPR) repeat protein
MVTALFRAGRLLTSGQKLVAQERLAEALAAFDQAIALRPHAAGLCLHQALALSDAARVSEAVAAMQHAMVFQPMNPVLPMFLGQILFDHADYTEARRWCEQAVTLTPYNGYTLALLALLEVAQGAFPQGYERLQAPLPFPIPVLERTVLWLTRSHVPSLLQQANAALQSRALLYIETYLLQYEAQAHPLAQQLVDQPPEAAETVGRRLMAWLDQGLLRGVLGLQRLYTVLRYVGQPTPRATALLMLQAEEAAYRGDLQPARSLYTQRLRQEPDVPFVHQQLCYIAYEQGEFRQALTHLQRVLAQQPNGTSVHPAQSLLLGELLYHAGHYEAAVAALTQAATETWRDYKTFYYLGLCALRRGEPFVARRQFARAVSVIHPDIVTRRLEEMARVHQQLARH